MCAAMDRTVKSTDDEKQDTHNTQRKTQHAVRMKNQNQNRSANVSLQDIGAVIDGLKELRQKMPFLIALTALERRNSTHVGLGNLAAAEDCLMAAREHPSILPGHFDLAQFEQNVKVSAGLFKCLTALKELSSDVQDTLLAIGGETLKGTRQIRAQVKIAAAATPGLKQLAQRFASGTSRAVGAETSAAPPTVDAGVPTPVVAPSGPAAPASPASTSTPAVPAQPAPASAPETKAA